MTGLFNIKNARGIGLIFLILFSILLGVGASAYSVNYSGKTRYITWESREMDTWASVWLISHYIDPQAEVVIRPTGSPSSDGIAFAIPDARFKKEKGKSTFEHLAEHYKIDQPEVKKIAQLIQAIEVTPWSHTGNNFSRRVEQAYRQMDKQFRPEKVSVPCYDSFFNNLANLQRLKASMAINASLKPDCDIRQATSSFRDKKDYVRLLPINNILEIMGKGKRVVFVDTREAAEYEEMHIPDAINIKLRDVNASVKPLLAKADLVIVYCIKDFRGYEVANALNKIGVRNVATMAPFGLAGWRSYKLPVVDDKSLSETEARKALTDFIHGKSMPAALGNG